MDDNILKGSSGLEAARVPKHRKTTVFGTLVFLLAILLVVMIPQSAFAVNSAKYTMSNNFFNVQVGQFGDIYSLKLTGDAFPTNYVMNAASATAQDTTDHEWLGELMFQYRPADSNGVYPSSYTQALTNLSSDIRTMSQDPVTGAVTVNYPGNAANAQGIKNFSVSENYALINDYLSWKITLTNTSSTNLELGDIGLPLPFNEYWTVPGGTEVYETQVVFHSFTGNNGSYINVTRPSGLGNSLLMTPDSSAGPGSGAGFEYMDHWRNAEHPGSKWDQDATGWANGLNVFYINSNVIKSTNRGYLPNTSTFLAPGESKTYAFKFFSVASADPSDAGYTPVSGTTTLKNKLYSEGLIDVTAVPGMTIPLNMTAQVDLHTFKTINSITTLDPNGNPTATMTYKKTVTDPVDGTTHQIYTLTLTTLGQNNVTINYGSNEKTVLQFYGMEPNAAAIQRHATFTVQSQQVNDPTKYYNKIFDDWMMDTKAKKTDSGAGTNAAGWGDDWGWTHGEFLAEKEVDFPVASEINAVDQYLETAIWGYLMRNHHTDYKINDWFTQTDTGSWYTRAFPYPHAYNTYFSMYKTEKLHPQITTYLHDRNTYLLRAYGIYKSLWDNLSPSGTGLMGEQTTPELIQALRDEGYNTQADFVASTITRKYNGFKAQKYPYGSEYNYDNTGEEAVYMAAKYSGNNAMMEKINLKTRATRGGQPTWYYYADPVTICGEGWWDFQYSTSLIGYPMDDWTRNYSTQPELDERMNYAAKIANLTVINSGQIDSDPANIGTAAWTYQSEKGNIYGYSYDPSNSKLHNGWRQMTGEADLGIWGTMKILSSDVSVDPIFGLLGYGCDVVQDGSNYVITPKDGLNKRLNLITQKLNMTLEQDQYTSATVATTKDYVDFTLLNQDLTAHTTKVSFTGLKTGSYSIKVNGVQTGAFNAPAGQTASAMVKLGADANSDITIQYLGTDTVNTAPIVSAGGGNAQTGTNVGFPTAALSGAASDDGLPAGSTLATTWSLVSGPGTATFTNAGALSTSVTVSDPGTYVFQLVASDGVLTSDPSTVSFTFIPNTAPTVNAGTAKTFIAPSVLLNGTASDPDNLPNGTLTTTWSLLSGPGTATFGNKNALNTSATVSIDGTYVFQLSASDGDLTSTSTVTMTVTPALPDKNGIGNVASYAFDETSGTTASDSSGYGNSATLKSAVTWTTGAVGNAANLNGTSNAYVTMPTGVISALNDFTISAWVYENAAPGSYARLWDFGNDTNTYMYMTLAGTSRPKWGITISGNGAEQSITASSAGALSTGKWYHIALTLSGNTATMYVNGTSVGTNTGVTLRPSSLGMTVNNYIGKSQFGDPMPNMKVDNFQIYNRALTAAQIKALMISSINAVTVQTTAGVAPVLPATVTVNYSSGTNASQAVVWDSINPSLYAQSGTFTVNGTVSGTSVLAKANVTAIVPAISSIPDIYITALAGTAPILPSTVTANMNNGTVITPNVTWAIIDPSQYAQAGVFSITGTVDGTAIPANAHISVLSASQLSSIDPITVTTQQIIAPNLPTTVTVEYGDQTSAPAYVVWDAIAPSQYANVGSFTETGKIVGVSGGADIPVQAAINVVAPTITALGNVSVTANIGKAPALPATVTATYSNGTNGPVTVAWNSIAPSQYAVTGTFTVTGSVAGTALTSTVTVTVVDPLILWYKLDETSGTNVTDSSAKATNGTLNGNVQQWTPGYIGGALQLDGTSNIINAGTGTYLQPSAITVSYWIKRVADMNARENVVFWAKPSSSYNGNGWYTTYNGTSSIMMVDGTSNFYVNLAPNSFLPLNQWTMITVTFDSASGQCAIYKNGVAQTVTKSGTPASITSSSSVTKYLGYSTYSHAADLTATMDDFRIYNTALNASDVLAMYNANAPVITGYSAVNVTTLAAMAPVLPATVTATLNDGTTQTVNVTWAPSDPSNYAAAGSFTTQGSVSGSSVPVTANITVTAPSISSIQDSAVITSAGYAPSLPSQVTLVWNNQTTSLANVTWDRIDPMSYAQAGTITVQGTVDGTALKATAAITVTNTAVTTLKGSGVVSNSAAVSLTYGLVGIQSISAQDVTVSYDKNVFDFVGADPIANSLSIQQTVIDADNGTVRLIMASTGAENAISGSADVVKLNFKSKASGTGNIAITNAELSTGNGEVSFAAVSSMSVDVVDKTGLADGITAAQQKHDDAVEGIDPGQYPGSAIQALKAAIDIAAGVNDDPLATSSAVAQAVSDLSVAVTVFNSTVVIEVDKTALRSAITAARLKHDNATIGNDPGDYPKAAADAFQTAIDAATAVSNRISATTAEVAQAAVDLNAASATFDSSVLTSADKTALIAAINTAQSIYDNAVEGISIGQYPYGLKDKLNTALANATAVKNGNPTEAQVAQAIADLNAAVGTFQSLVITSSTGNIDGKEGIGVGDLGIVAGHFGMKAGDPNWNLYKNADINGDGEIGIFELAFIALKMIER